MILPVTVSLSEPSVLGLGSSNRKKSPAPITISAVVNTSTKCEYRVSRCFLRMRTVLNISATTINPSPPVTTSSIVVITITGSLANADRLVNLPVMPPNTSKPALQNDETEWNTLR